MPRTPLYLFSTVFLALSAHAQSGPELTARELFYSAAQQPAARAAKPGVPNKKAAPVARTTAATNAPPKMQPHVSASDSAAAPPPAASGIILAAAHTSAPAPTNGPALGLRFTIRKRVDGQMVEVAPDSVFHAGDAIELDLESNTPGYLYMISKGSSGTWKPIFPSKEVQEGDNHIDGFHTYQMPPHSRLVFDEQAGEERLFVVLSRTPEPDLENLIYSLQGSKTAPAATPQQPKPAATPAKTMVADLRIDDRTVGLLRTAYARDLVIEKVDADTPGDKKEKAVYVVNPTGSADSRVVADVVLVHK